MWSDGGDGELSLAATLASVKNGADGETASWIVSSGIDDEFAADSVWFDDPANLDVVAHLVLLLLRTAVDNQ